MVIERAVYRRGEANDRRAHAAGAERDREVLGVGARSARYAVFFGADAPEPAEGEHERSGGRHERLARPREPGADRLNRA